VKAGSNEPAFFLEEVKMEIGFTNMLFIFFCGVFAHAFGLRLFGIWSKTMMYRMTFINCLALLKLSEGTSKELLTSSCTNEREREAVETIFKYWQKMALTSLRTVIPDGIWQGVATDDWDQAMKILSNIEKGVEDDS
tara:strand:+ start:260 stop:670 length:411 start_codon:yes stop_codon:yes gene_type:complete